MESWIGGGDKRADVLNKISLASKSGKAEWSPGFSSDVNFHPKKRVVDTGQTLMAITGMGMTTGVVER